ncbi:unnamed protein product [Menidia menidia]|uniref:(Atlantic silverside) hypothetical protein n=1 Tax=Menidia menidia TaxID=238744 RepID=A0A8S4AKE7_9TELE|nr:unnamed protein product [Menidia menidia]
MSKWTVTLDCNPVLKKREKMVCIMPTQMMLEDAYSLAERRTFSYPPLMPLLEDPKMELKTVLPSLRLGLLTAFHQCTEARST